MAPKKKTKEVPEATSSAPHPFLRRIMANKQLFYKDGSLFLMGIPSYIFALNTLVVMQKALEEEFGQKGLTMMYHFLGYQTTMAAKMMKNRFGFSSQKAMQTHQGQSDMIGAGKIDFIHMDMKNNHFILRGHSTFGKEYLSTFGIQKEPVDWLFKGGITKLINEYLGRDDIVCVETSCIAQGNSYCEFVAKPRGSFDTKDPKIKKQLPSDVSFDFKKIIEKNLRGMPQRR